MIDQVYNAADKWLKSRVNVRTELNSREISERLPPSVRAHSFFSARVGEARIVEGLREISDQYSRGEINLAAARQMLREFVSKDGKYDPKNPSITNLASRARAELILDQNRRMAAAVAEYEAGMDPDIIDRFPYWRYHARGDERTRSSHAVYDGKVFRKTDPIWRRIFPPWQFRCRCWVEELTEEEAGDLGGAVTMPTPPVPESGYEFDPAHAFADFDLSRITDPRLRETTAQAIGDMLGEEVSRSGDVMIAKTEKKAKFIPAKTMQEAKEFAQKYIGDTASIPSSFKDLEMMNKFNELVHKNMNEFGLEKFKNIRITKSRNISAWVSPQGDIAFNPLWWRNQDRAFAESITAFEKAGQVRWLAVDRSDRYLQHVVDHEFGHLLYWKTLARQQAAEGFTEDKHFATGQTIRKFNISEAETPISKAVDLAFSRAKKSGDINKISQYSAKNKEEFVSETFAMHRAGGKLPDYIESMIKEIQK